MNVMCKILWRILYLCYLLPIYVNHALVGMIVATCPTDNRELRMKYGFHRLLWRFQYVMLADAPEDAIISIDHKCKTMTLGNTSIPDFTVDFIAATAQLRYFQGRVVKVGKKKPQRFFKLSLIPLRQTLEITRKGM